MYSKYLKLQMHVELLNVVVVVNSSSFRLDGLVVALRWTRDTHLLIYYWQSRWKEVKTAPWEIFDNERQTETESEFTF